MAGHVTHQPTLADEPTESAPSGPAWRAAIAHGIDVSLLEANLSLTPTERLLQLQNMLLLFEAARAAGEGFWRARQR